MTRTQEHQTVHEIDIAAPVDVVYGIIADPTRWPRYFTPTVHVERTMLDTETERLRIWATGNTVVRAWTSIRAIDPERHQVSFRQEVSAPPVKSMSGCWTVRPVDEGVQLVLTHDFEAVDDDPAHVEWITKGTNENSTVELANIKRLAESWGRLRELEFSFEDSLVIHAPAADIYDFLQDAARWPERLPHVAGLDLRETDAGVQQMSMWTRAKDDSTHLTESVRVCFPHDRIVYKQLVTPVLINAHTGAWLIEPAEDGVVVRAQHTILLNEEAVGTIPAAGLTVESTRDFVRASIGGNSRATLGFAKAYAEAL
ncbi:aromatase/cyclase [Kibdelosporangium lantanae]|uniref:Aromatase/cyclase n=1 Tax=Kibdelosporangium lantanae TaxID=1497396 RepID=A0ABW3MCW4_9PSEU